MAPPTESQILYSYLLHPSPLPTILPFSSFQNLMRNKNGSSSSSSSSARRYNPELERLYRDLQFQRDITVDDIRRRIDEEVRHRGRLLARLRRQIRREGLQRVSSTSTSYRSTRKRKRDIEDDGETDLDEESESESESENEGHGESEDRRRQRSNSTPANVSRAGSQAMVDGIRAPLARGTDKRLQKPTTARDGRDDPEDSSEGEDKDEEDVEVEDTYEDESDSDSDSDSHSHSSIEPERVVETTIDIHLDGPRGQTLQPHPHPHLHTHTHTHTISTLLAAMTTAKRDMTREIADLESELKHLQRTCEERVGGLSDLRYGRFAGPSDAQAPATTTTSTTGSASTVELEVVGALRELTARLA